MAPATINPIPQTREVFGGHIPDDMVKKWRQSGLIFARRTWAKVLLSSMSCSTVSRGIAECPPRTIFPMLLPGCPLGSMRNASETFSRLLKISEQSIVVTYGWGNEAPLMMFNGRHGHETFNLFECGMGRAECGSCHSPSVYKNVDERGHVSMLLHPGGFELISSVMSAFLLIEEISSFLKCSFF